ncbi:rod shape-determining protein MreD [Staphylococcus pseudoxylosus]|uniref:Rod shape-determining protein MreD n=1 Tax=Staphylococcus pseudoxylosus TaxID=2282419 RepID=A0AAQ0MLR1_9STAP|nr:rod shape-determining protein MreD [Staphylococcus pseudoxylosus]PTI81241.1 rod shape-determining protein MreD [Staphylococcus xylosus]MBM2658422.1 rod shape-determining protein MreD [Staphylococcus pseudoxylosus]MCE5001887.1 rod shape-determining protein MreD [Staphylococcus pseudoxylosus]MDW8546962.1 rod shape-determining protein MreD [Staphylococcus pseudoxylosus]MEB5783526.1 rod shape-determining protein MreD [Staphylococcus pseudoxylosus]
MRALYYFLIGIVLFYIDTAIGLIIPMQIGTKDIIFVPHLTLMYLLIICVHRSFGVAIILSTVLGLITDLYFGSFYGLYLFGYILFVVIQDFFFKTFYRDDTMLFFVVLLSTIFLEIYVAIIYSILGLIAFNLFDFVLYRLIPTLVLNFILLIIFYPIITKFFRKVQLKIDSKKA